MVTKKKSYIFTNIWNLEVIAKWKESTEKSSHGLTEETSMTEGQRFLFSKIFKEVKA